MNNFILTFVEGFLFQIKLTNPSPIIKYLSHIWNGKKYPIFCWEILEVGFKENLPSVSKVKKFFSLSFDCCISKRPKREHLSLSKREKVRLANSNYGDWVILSFIQECEPLGFSWNAFFYLVHELIL